MDDEITQNKEEAERQSERFVLVRKALNMSAAKMAAFLGISEQHVYGIGNKKRGIPKGVLTQLARLESPMGRINFHWLLTGEGEMFNQPTPPPPELQATFMSLFHVIDGFARDIRELQERVERLENR